MRWEGHQVSPENSKSCKFFSYIYERVVMAPGNFDIVINQLVFTKLAINTQI